MQWHFVVLASIVTSAILITLDDRRRQQAQTEPSSNGMKAAIVFAMILVFSCIFYWFDVGTSGGGNEQGRGDSHGGGNSESQRIQNIREDCHDGIPPF